MKDIYGDDDDDDDKYRADSNMLFSFQINRHHHSSFCQPSIKKKREKKRVARFGVIFCSFNSVVIPIYSPGGYIDD